MRLADCEITHRHIRGHNVAFVFGSRAVSDEEAQALADEWVDTYGPIALPGFVSPQGWQSLAPLERGPIASRLKVDELAQVIEFDGVRMSAELLAALAVPSPEGVAFRVLRSADGVATFGRVELPPPQRQQSSSGKKAGQTAAPAPTEQTEKPPADTGAGNPGATDSQSSAGDTTKGEA